MSGEHPATILIVEDDASLVRLYSALFRTEGYCVRVSRNGVDGLTALAEKRPDAIILDLSMPVMDGRTFYGLCREQGFDGPVIISSAFGAQAAQHELGADAYITKPFIPEVLVATLRGLL